MADDFALALQKALHDWLKADAGVASLVDGRVYDEPPQDAKRPYIRLESFELRPLRSDKGRAADVVFRIESHSRPNSGKVEATRCAEAVAVALDEQAVPVNGFTLVYLRALSQAVDQDDDGESYTGASVFEALLDDTTAD